MPVPFSLGMSLYRLELGGLGVIAQVRGRRVGGSLYRVEVGGLGVTVQVRGRRVGGHCTGLS